MQIEIGVCSECGGRVTVPQVWHGVIPPVPTCQSCGAVARARGPVIPMEPAPVTHTGTTAKGWALQGCGPRVTWQGGAN